MRAEANAKLILAGEHAVVYGVPAIAVPVRERYVRVEVLPSNTSPAIEVTDSRPGADTRLAAAMARLALDLDAGAGIAARGAHVKIASTIPIGCGLGSSAALAVALVRATAEGGAARLGPVETARRALELEKLAHGTPSGVDSTAIAFERPIVFQKGDPPEPLDSPAPVRLAAGCLPRTGTTASLVAGVRALRETDEARFRKLLDAVSSAVGAARRAVAWGQMDALGAALDDGQGLLRELGVSTPAVDAACEAARRAGALGAKLSGAGGGGAVIALLGPTPDAEAILRALRGAVAAEAFVTEVGASP